MVAFDILVGSSALAWLYLAAAHGGFWRVRDKLLPAAVPGSRRRVICVIPARDEADSIGAAVQSLIGQADKVVVVDDNSSDRTAAIALSAGADVVQGKPLPEGWTGKLWAVHQGVVRALQYGPEFLLLTDADIRHAPDSVAQLVAKADSEKRDLVSVMVRLRCRSFAERLTIPAFVFFFFQLYPPQWIGNARRRTAGAAGGCMLLRPEALQRAGGIEAIRSELIDDCALAAAVKRSGGSLCLGLSSDTESLRPYPEFADVRNMIARTAFTQLRYSSWMLAGTTAGMVFLYGVPVAGVLRGNLVAVAALIIMTGIYAPLARFYRQPAWSGVLLPITALFYLWATIESAVRYWTGRGGSWKGRDQALAASLPPASVPK